VEGTHPALTVTLALAAGVLAQSLARHVRVPGIVLLLVAGASLGPDGLGWVEPQGLGDGMFAIVDLAVAVILFEGGLNLEISRLRRAQAPIRRLVTFGALVTLLGGTVAVRALLEWDWAPAVLFGSLVVVTGPTVVGPLISELRLRPKVATVLEAEGVLIDPIGAIVAVLVLELVLAPGADAFASGTLGLAISVGFGAGAGALAGVLIAWILRIRPVVPEGYENIMVLASVLLLFQGCSFFVPHSGILAVAIAGVVVGNIRSPVDRDLREFKDQLSVLLIGLLFVLLAADIRFDDVQALGWRGLGVVAALVIAVRPAGVLLSTLASDLSGRERLFIAWVAPRGIVAAAIASLTAVALQKAGLEGATELRALVFLTIGGTVLLAGLTAGPVAALLGQRLPGRDAVAILGAGGMGLALAKELRAAEVPVVFLDANPQSCRRAEEAGFPVVYGDALQERTLTRARFDRVAIAIGLTAIRSGADRHRLDRQSDTEQRIRHARPRAFPRPAGLRGDDPARGGARARARAERRRGSPLRGSARRRALGRARATRGSSGGAMELPRRGRDRCGALARRTLRGPRGAPGRADLADVDGFRGPRGGHHLCLCARARARRRASHSPRERLGAGSSVRGGVRTMRSSRSIR
jgi:NhaP-type Na+/H+ or K+/H+ antiporter